MLKRLVRFFRYVVFGTVGACALLALAGCANPAPAPEPTTIYFTDEQLHDACDGDQGCVLVPGDVWQTIANMLQGKDA